MVDELDGVDTERSREGQAPMASEGDTLGEGDVGRSIGELGLLMATASMLLYLVKLCYSGRGRLFSTSA